VYQKGAACAFPARHCFSDIKKLLLLHSSCIKPCVLIRLTLIFSAMSYFILKENGKAYTDMALSLSPGQEQKLMLAGSCPLTILCAPLL
jgi:hypothetical protein